MAALDKSKPPISETQGFGAPTLDACTPEKAHGSRRFGFCTATLRRSKDEICGYFASINTVVHSRGPGLGAKRPQLTPLNEICSMTLF